MSNGTRFSTIEDPSRRPDGTRKHDTAKVHHPSGTVNWLAVDGEGVTLPTGEHRYVLLGAGQDQIEDPNGLHWSQIFPFLYAHRRPYTAMCGFYLGYDFTQWLKTLPEERASKLLTIEGRESRRSKSPAMHGRYLPVDVGNEWQLDMLGAKRLALRPAVCDCATAKCPHDQAKWLYVCDAGGFFQTSFLNVINPANWQHPIVSEAEYALVIAGKESRGTAALDDDMRTYNRLENELLQRVLHDLDGGFRKLDVTLSPRQWFGPGQSAQEWMRGRGIPTKELIEVVPDWFLDAARQSFFGGWFELAAHGPIPGTCHENDINNAYPHIISTLPCLRHGTYNRGSGRPTATPPDTLCLVRALVRTYPENSNDHSHGGLGAMLHRDRNGRISRPLITAGWYWSDELDAAQAAGCIAHVETYEWIRYDPCDCPPPLWQVKNLYRMRLEVGKKSTLGKASKLVNNSIYGKTAQSTGIPVFGNPIYASRITSGCRRMILDAIASHPGGKQNVVMVATDAVFFLDPHPGLDYGAGLGQWETTPRISLTLFKPGVYWDDAARDALSRGDHPSFKARGVNARAFAGSVAELDAQFDRWADNPPDIELHANWPQTTFEAGFAMTTALQALTRRKWDTAGYVNGAKLVRQDSWPGDKRRRMWHDTTDPSRPLWRSEPLEAGPNARYRTAENFTEWGSIPAPDYGSIPYEKKFGLEDPFSDESQQAFGVSPDEPQPLRGAFRVITGQE